MEDFKIHSRVGKLLDGLKVLIYHNNNTYSGEFKISKTITGAEFLFLLSECSWLYNTTAQDMLNYTCSWVISTHKAIDQSSFINAKIIINSEPVSLYDFIMRIHQYFTDHE